MEFVKEYVFFYPNIEGIDEIIGKARSDCSYKHIYSNKLLRLIYNIKVVDMKKKQNKKLSIKRYTNWNDVIHVENETKTKIKTKKINKLTLQNYGNVEDLNKCYHLKLPFR